MPRAKFGPIWNTQYVVCNDAALVWDMLYCRDDRLQPRRQMVEAEEVGGRTCLDVPAATGARVSRR
jgi:homospermidine synthase